MLLRKKCSCCKAVKPVDCFSANKTKKDGFNGYCKECNKVYQKKHYRRHKETYLEGARTRRRKVCEWLRDLKASLRCEECGESHPACLDFHHADPSEKTMSVAQATRYWSKERILKEIQKCKVWCSNCHRKHHWPD